MSQLSEAELHDFMNLSLSDILTN